MTDGANARDARLDGRHGQSAIAMRYYTAAVHRAAFVLPPNTRELAD